MTSLAAPTSRPSVQAGRRSSISGSTSDPALAAQGRAFRHRLRFLFALLTLPGALAAPGSVRAGSTLLSDTPRPDSAVATIHVATEPPGLLVVVDGVRVGRAPVGPLWVPAKTIRVQALSDDPRRFEPARDTVLVTPRPGDALEILLDMRPSVLVRSVPEPATLFLERPDGGAGGVTGLTRDSLIGETPLRLLPSKLERRTVKLSAPEHADTAVAGASLLALAQDGPVTIRLRRTSPHQNPPPPRAPPLIKRRWLQITMIGMGAALTGASAILRHTADRWYDRYLESSDSREIPYFYDQTAHYDRLAGGFLASGQVLLTAGIFLLVTSTVH